MGSMQAVQPSILYCIAPCPSRRSTADTSLGATWEQGCLLRIMAAATSDLARDGELMALLGLTAQEVCSGASGGHEGGSAAAGPQTSSSQQIAPGTAAAAVASAVRLQAQACVARQVTGWKPGQQAWPGLAGAARTSLRTTASHCCSGRLMGTAVRLGSKRPTLARPVSQTGQGNTSATGRQCAGAVPVPSRETGSLCACETVSQC